MFLDLRLHFLVACVIIETEGTEEALTGSPLTAGMMTDGQNLPDISAMDSRIFSGTNAVKGQFPFMVRTLVVQPHSYISHIYAICGGTLINQRWVISAAHCAFNGSSVQVFLGMVAIDDNDVVSYTINKKGIIIHPLYRPNTYPSPDIVLYKLPVEINCAEFDHIKVIPLSTYNPTDITILDEQIVTAAGWGITRSGVMANILQYVAIKVLNNSACRKKFFPATSKATICTEKYYKEGGSCTGDSGGPLLISVDGKFELVGITSFGIGRPPCYDPEGIDVYTYVPTYKEWIIETMETA